MHNQINFRLAPQDLFLNPATDEGMAFLRPPEFMWRPIPHATICGFAASAHPAMNDRIEAYIASTARHRTFGQAIEFNTVPVLLSDVWFKKSYVSAKGRCLLSGAAGTRLVNRYIWENDSDGRDPESELVAYFADCQAGSGALPVLTAPPPAATPIAIECRNTFNYYHFITESLCQLCLIAEYDLQGPINFHYPNTDDKLRGFTKSFVAALFPDLLPRITFQRAPVQYDSVIGTYNFLNGYYHLPDAVMPGVDHHIPSRVYWRGKQATRNSQALLGANSVDSSLLKLRARALQAIQGHDFSHLPKRFWVGRDDGQARKRQMEGEADLVDMLALFGFEYIAFERLTPLEQIAIMANAEVMMSYHGAGFTNMLFANPQATVIEIGTLQTAVFRWGDFWKLATAAQCRYVSFFADYNTADPLKDPSFADEGIVPVALSKAGLAQIMAFVVSVLGKLPTLPRADDVVRLGRQLMAIGETRRAADLFALHRGLENGHFALATLIAECHETLGQDAEQLSALYAAFRADPQQWAPLVQIVWCARKLNDSDTMRAALTVLRDSFPDRYEGFVKSRPWFQNQIDPSAEKRPLTPKAV